MKLIEFEKLPKEFQNESVKIYYDILNKKKGSLILKRVTDIFISLLLLIILLIPMLIISIIIKCTSKGPVFYKQLRVTTYGKKFNILKFRTMKIDADKEGPLVTFQNDNRITPVGKGLRKFRLDELPQVIHVLSGKMSIVGTRPEVSEYVNKYTDEMMATLLMPAGITSLASIKFKDEDKMLENCENVEDEYITKILPQKMVYNLQYLSGFGFRQDLHLMLKTVKDVLL